jgi:hypothetical protein
VKDQQAATAKGFTHRQTTIALVILTGLEGSDLGYRRLGPATATYGDMAGATPIRRAEGDPGSDVITRYKEMQAQNLRDNQKTIDHRLKWEGVEHRRSNVMTELRRLREDIDRLIYVEENDVALREAGQQVRNEILKQRKR